MRTSPGSDRERPEFNKIIRDTLTLFFVKNSQDLQEEWRMFKIHKHPIPYPTCKSNINNNQFLF